MNVIRQIENKFSGGNLRTALANKNVLYSFLLKGMNILVQLAIVPLMLHYLDSSLYGIWLTIVSVMLWMSFFDIGIGNGLRIRLAEALAKNDLDLARIFISTAYAIVAIIFGALLLIFWLVFPFINWTHFFNVSVHLVSQINYTILIVISFACLQFITGLISSILFAKQRMALNSAIGPLSNLISLINIYILVHIAEPSLATVAFYFSLAQPAVLLGLSIYLFKGPYKNISPSFSSVNFRYSKDLLNLGAKFMVVQFSALTVYLFSNLIITRLFGPSQVTIYNLAYKYFMMSVMINGIISQTYWSSLTQAYMNHDFVWIRGAVKKLENITIFLMVATLISLLVADPLIHGWVGREFNVPFSLKISMCLSAIVTLFSTPQNMLVNGTGSLHLQFLIATVTIPGFILLAFLFSKIFFMGPSGIIVAMIVTTLPNSLLIRIQYNKLMNGNASGLWSKK